MGNPIMDDQQYLSSFEELLGQLVQSSTDTARIQTASTTLNAQYYDQARCVPALVELVNRSEHWQIRQLAAVELRKRNARWWKELDANTKTTIRSCLLECVMKEPEVLVRNAIARAISSVAQEEGIKDSWPDLQPFLEQCIADGNAGQREVGIYVLYSLLDVIVDYSPEQLNRLIGLFSRTLMDPESKEVRITTLQALSTLADSIEGEEKAQVRLLQDQVPNMIAVLQQCITEGDESSLAKGFDALDSMMLLETPILSRHIPQLIEFSFNVGSNKGLDDSARVMALSFLLMTSIYKKTRLQKAKLVTPMIQHLMPIATEDDPEDVDDDSPSRVALRVIQSLSSSLPPTQVFPTLLQLILEYMTNPAPGYRKAAMMAFAASVEGCADFMRSKINELMQLVFAGLQDPDATVRRAACLALSCVADEIEEAVTNNHAVLLPLLFNLIVCMQCTRALLDNLGDEILQYMPTLMEKLVILMENTQGEMRCTVVNAVGSAAQTSGPAFAPYFHEVMVRLQPMMAYQGTEDDDVVLRGVATDTAGAIATAVGKEAFMPYLEPTMLLAVEALQLQGPRLRETSYSFFTLMAGVFGESMAPFLPTIVPQLLHTCKQDETNGVELVNEAEEIDLGEEGLEDDDEEEEAFRLNTALGDEKEIAADAIGELVEATRGHFMPYASDCVNSLIKMLDHYSDGVRKSSIASLLKFVYTFSDMATPEGTQWIAGLPLQQPVHENVASIIQLVMPALLQAWKEEDDKMVAIVIQQELADAIKRVGPSMIADYVKEVNTAVLEVLEGKSYCQTAELDDEDEDFGGDDENNGDQSEHDALLISSSTDMIGALSVALGASFVDYFRVYLPHLLSYYAPNKSTSERSMTIGCIGETTSGLKEGVSEFTETIYAVVSKALVDPEEEVRSNAAFAIGTLCQYSTVDVSSQYPAILAALSPLFQCKLPNAVDNACGAIARLIIAHPNAIQLEEVLPVLVQHLPLRTDYAENEPVYRCLIQLIRSSHPAIASHLPALRGVFAQVLSSPEDQLTSAVRSELLEVVQQLGA
ncbi:armadillo-type protein [Syncephalis fuscata]|nr:armadillo-type protein [Syncephalis fuscata]